MSQQRPDASLRVLAVMPGFTPEAGAETSLAAVAPHLVAAGVDLHLALFTAVRGLVPAVEAAGVSVHDLSGHAGLVGRAGALRHLVRRVRPDLVHATLFDAAVPAQLAALATHRKVLVTWANTPVRVGESPQVGRVKLALVRVVEIVVGAAARTRYHAVTEGVARTQCRALLVPRRRVRVAERGRDPRVFAPRPPEQLGELRRSLGLADDARVVLAVGRQDVTKRHAVLVRAFDDVAERHPDVVLLVAGREGSASAELQALLPTLRHADRVRLLGHRDDVAALLQIAATVVCSSVREGAAGALLEAMASGAPVVSVHLDGLDGVLADGVNARVVAPSELARGLDDVLNDPAGASVRAERARADFHERFTVERAAAALVDVYRWAAR